MYFLLKIFLSLLLIVGILLLGVFAIFLIKAFIKVISEMRRNK